MRYLLLSSFVFLLACSESPYRSLQASSTSTECLAKFKPDFSSVLYNTHVNVTGKHLSGLLIFKKMPDSTVRAIFSSEMGVKFFDFEYSKSGFKVEYCMKQLDRKAVIKQLKKDIGFIIMNGIDISSGKSLHSATESYFLFHSGKEETYYITDSACTRLLRIENASKRKKKVIINLNDYKDGMADSVYIAHQTFEFNISLKQLKR